MDTAYEAKLSAQKLVKGEKVAEFVRDHVNPKKKNEKLLKLQHKFLLKQERHISSFNENMVF